MIKNFLNVDLGTKRITRKQYNQEIKDAVARLDVIKTNPLISKRNART